MILYFCAIHFLSLVLLSVMEINISKEIELLLNWANPRSSRHQAKTTVCGNFVATHGEGIEQT